MRLTMKIKTRKPLRLDSETLKTLSTETLGRVQGGDRVGDVSGGGSCNAGCGIAN
jgi:hypothetical protein